MNVYNGVPINAHATNASFDSALVEAVAPSGMFKFSFIAKASHSSAAGSLQLQASNTPTNTTGTYTWMNVGSSVSISGTTVAGLAAIDTAYARLKLVYTDSSSGSSTATLTVETMALLY